MKGQGESGVDFRELRRQEMWKERREEWPEEWVKKDGFVKEVERGKG